MEFTKKGKKGLSDRVEDLLDKKQSNKKISVDISIDGENKRIFKSQKKTFALNELLGEAFLKEIHGLSNIEKINIYRIEKFATPYNVQEDIDNNVPGDIVFLKYKAYEDFGKGIGKKLSIKGLENSNIQKYVDMYPYVIKEYSETLKNIKTKDDLEKFREIFWVGNAFVFDTESKKFVEYKNQNRNNPNHIMLDGANMIGKSSIAYINNAWRIGGINVWSYARKQYAKITEEEIQQDYNIKKSYFEEKNPGKNYSSYEAFKSSLQLYAKDNNYSFIKGKEGITDIEKKDDNEKKILKQILSFGHKEIKKRPVLESYKILGDKIHVLEDKYFKNGNVKGILEDYGLSKINFGNSIDDKTAKEKLLQTINAFDELEKFIGLPVKKLNSMNGLGLAYSVASGLGGEGHLAHYNSTENFINFTKKGFDGTLAHEYFHYVDHLLFKKFVGDEIFDKDFGHLYLISDIFSGNTGNLKENIKNETIRNALEKLVNGFYNLSKDKDSLGESLIVYPNLNLKSRYIFNVNFLRNTQGISLDEKLEKYKEALFNRYRSLSTRYKKDYEKMATNFISILFEENKKEMEKFITTNEKEGISPYKLNHLKLKSPFDINIYSEIVMRSIFLDKKKTYFSTTKELLARGFEVYVQEKLKLQNHENNFLVSQNDGGIIEYPQYAQGEERKKILELFDTFFTEIKKEL